MERAREVADVLARWLAAEAAGDVAGLDDVLDDGFQGDDPAGFVLDKEAWLDRHRSGDLVPRAFTWRDTEVRVHDGTAVAMGVQAQEVSYRGRDCSGEFRATLVAVRFAARWRIVNLQLKRVS